MLLLFYHDMTLSKKEIMQSCKSKGLSSGVTEGVRWMRLHRPREKSCPF